MASIFCPPDPIAVDPACYADGDSYPYDENSDSGTSSLDSLVVTHILENGRRYHGFRAGRYLLPNDKPEQERLDLLHHILRQVFTDTYTAPLSTLKPLRRILDLGTGTGRWAIDTAYAYPSATVMGIDLSPIQPSWVPSNCSFEIDDLESPWTVAPGSVDYIHARGLSGSIREWPALLAQAHAALRHGGCVEVTEVVAEMAPVGEVGREYELLLAAAHERAGRRLGVAEEVPGWLTEAGFVNVAERRGRMPVGKWPLLPAMKELGKLYKEVVLAGLEARAVAPLTRYLGWSKEEVEVLVGNLRREVGERGAQRCGRVVSWVAWKA
ncbi:S-adenosyl-L-methionine-dependent methyltransferase [Tricharina praecox]|uniref:S-adenosyl-L-methionine-dependent methyltransferase n=1 Tax=Tricharina praecox TaxID=43433 RepID=UPI0022203555|nr:S-adenosyl-L-methionine-dependent methyltransferase [Tricharina praecox]KAI5841610.1 S-adenosyl-L-methionine-dependent methyltransferase [Tricharina praecox]